MLPALGGAGYISVDVEEPEPEQEQYGVHPDLLMAEARSPGGNPDSKKKERDRTNDSYERSEAGREAKNSCHLKPGGAYYPRSHPFLKETSPSQIRSQVDYPGSTYNGIQGHLQESPPDQHRPIPASLTASFVGADIVRERGLVHGGSASERSPPRDEDDDFEEEDEDGGSYATAQEQRHGADAGGGGYIDDTSSVTSSGFGSLAANLAEARMSGAGADLDADLDMEYVIGEADAALRHALQANGLVVGGADTQGRLEEFVTDSLRTTQRFQQVSFQWKNPDFLIKNPDFLLKC